MRPLRILKARSSKSAITEDEEKEECPAFILGHDFYQQQGYITPMEPTTLLHDLSRGFACKCPKCGEGKLFSKWLKVKGQCEVCGEEFHHHRADDLPAYLVIFIMGHVGVALALELETSFSPELWMHAIITVPITVAFSLLLLQPVKGAVVALQWRIGMHGFKFARQKRDSEITQDTSNT
jgi:uncharacterized protein (DUF983 family)